MAFASALVHGQFPTDASSNGLRPVPTESGNLPSTTPVMVPLNAPAGLGFDPYATRPAATSGSLFSNNLSVPASSLPPTSSWPSLPVQPYSTLQPPSGYGTGTFAPGTIAPGTFAPGVTGPGVFPSYTAPTYSGPPSLAGPTYTGPQPILPGAGQSAIVNTYPSIPNQISPPGLYPNSSPSALFPGSYGSTGSFGTTGGSGSMFNDWFGGWFGNGSANPGYGGTYPAPGTYVGPGNYGTPTANSGWSWPWNWSAGGAQTPGTWNTNGWNPQGSVFNGQYAQPPAFIRLFQGPRIRHAYIHGDDKHNSLAVNDTDLSLAFLIPNFAWSTQPLYLLPSFSLHQWDGPFPHLDPSTTADLPSKAFSAFIDAGWQSDPARIFGAELGVRVGVFSDFDAISSKSIRIMGRGIGRVRLTPQVTAKLGVMYVDRNKVKMIPAGGILWQPNPGTRLDLFFPEPKLSAYLTTLGNVDTWWYVAGYYGGGTWTVERLDGTDDSIDINDIRVAFGLEWGRNDMMRDGRRIGFAEIGYAFERELLYKNRPADDLDLQDHFVIRIGLGY